MGECICWENHNTNVWAYFCPVTEQSYYIEKREDPKVHFVVGKGMSTLRKRFKNLHEAKQRAESIIVRERNKRIDARAKMVARLATKNDFKGE